MIFSFSVSFLLRFIKSLKPFESDHIFATPSIIKILSNSNFFSKAVGAPYKRLKESLKFF